MWKTTQWVVIATATNRTGHRDTYSAGAGNATLRYPDPVLNRFVALNRPCGEMACYSKLSLLVGMDGGQTIEMISEVGDV